MYMPRKVVLLLAATAALVFAVAASGHGGDDGKQDDHGKGKALLSATLAPSVPADVAIHGIKPGGVPWVLDRGSNVRLKADGELDLRLRGLIIPNLGTAGPVTTVSASLLCGADSTGPAATTGAVPLSSSGNARIEERIAVPATCLAPSVVVHPNGGTGAYIAVTGWKA
jgi:hypothetical protein